MFNNLLISVAFFLTSIFLMGDLNGSWLGKVKTPDGNEIDVTYNFKVNGDKLTGAVVTQWGESPIVDGKIKGDEYSFTQHFNDMQFMHSGKVSGDSIYAKIERADNPALEATFVRSVVK